MPYRQEPKKQSFEAHLYRMRQTNTYRTFVRIGIKLSPEQLNNIRFTINVYNPKRETAERSVNDFLQRFTGLSLPLYLTQWNNTAAATYLCMQQKLGNRSINVVRIQSNRVTLLQRTAETLCVGVDCVVYAMLAIFWITFSALVVNIIGQGILFHLEEWEEREPRIPRISGYLM